MLSTDTKASFIGGTVCGPTRDDEADDWSLPEPEIALAVALDLLERGEATRADEILTAATLKDPSIEPLWMAAGICRLRRGAVRSAAAAFLMASWLSGSHEARELLGICITSPSR